MVIRKALQLVFVVLLAATAAVSSCSAVDSGKAAPDFTLKDLQGMDFTFSSTKGKVVILDFWATWCPPCRMEIPHFQELYGQYKSDGLEIVGVALDQGGIRDVKPFAEQYGVTYPVVIGDQSVASSYGGIRAIPTTFIIDREGRITKTVVGYRDKAFFEAEIKELL